MKTYPFAEFYTIIGMIEEYYDAKRVVLNEKRMKHLQKYGYSGLELEIDNPEISAVLNKKENYETELDLGILEVLGIQLYRRFFSWRHINVLNIFLSAIAGGWEINSI